MNDVESLLNSDLDDTDGSVVAQVNAALDATGDSTIKFTPNDIPDENEPLVFATTPVEDEAPAVAPVAVRKGAGRKVDTTGKTALGKARQLYAANTGMTTKELKELFFTTLNPLFGTDKGTVQTYVSLVRKPKAMK